MYDLSGIGNLNSEPHALWDQWCFAGDSGFHGSFPAHGSDYHHGLAEIEGFIPDFIHDPHSSACTSSFLAQDSLAHPQASDSTNHGGSSSIAEYSLYPSPMQSEAKKRKLSHNKGASAEPSSRRGSTKKHQSARASAEEIHVNIQEYETLNEPTSSPSEISTQARKLRERNSRAANKVRSKKREVEKNLETAEKDMEQMNRELTAHAKELTHQVHSLKMQLLQHVGCDCVLIQEYIASEANRYIQDISGEAAASSK
jgi:hypothetical protein